MTHHTVGIIGAGWSGLVACKQVLDQGLDVVVLEGRECLGGVWHYSDRTDQATVMQSTETTSSRALMEMSDFPMPDHYPSFPHHNQILEYLMAYCDRFDLQRHIRFNCRVMQVEKQDQIWCVKTEEGMTYTFDRLIVSTGLHQKPNDLSQQEPYRRFAGSISHSITYKSLSAQYEGKRILIVGGGETASDIAKEICERADQVYWSIRNGQWFVSKRTPMGHPFDEISSILERFISPTYRLNGFFGMLGLLLSGPSGHGVEAWRSPAGFQRQFANKSKEVLKQVRAGQITPKPGVSDCQGYRVRFVDGSEVEVDQIICCTGYHATFDFLPPEHRQGLDGRFKLIFDVEDPTLAFVGFARPVIGSIPVIAEVQAKLVAEVFSGQLTLPDREQRRQITHRETQYWREHFRHTSRRIEGLVDLSIYMKILFDLGGYHPRLLPVLWQDPRHYWLVITAVYTNAMLLFNDPQQRDYVLSRIRFYRPTSGSFRAWILRGGWLLIWLCDPLCIVILHLQMMGLRWRLTRKIAW